MQLDGKIEIAANFYFLHSTLCIFLKLDGVHTFYSVSSSYQYKHGNTPINVILYYKEMVECNGNHPLTLTFQ